MNTVDGYEMSSWERGYGDFVFKPDMDTLRLVPWHEGTVLLMADLAWEDGSDVVASPRQILPQPARPPGRAGLDRRGRHRARVHRVPRQLRGRLAQGLPEPRPGQPLQRRLLDDRDGAHRAADPPHPQLDDGAGHVASRTRRASATSASTRSTSATTTRSQTADNHVIYKTGAKEIAAQEGMSITYMAKFDEREGNSCHIHLSLAKDGGGNVFADDEATFDRFVAGQLAALRELTLMFAPHVNSYKRFVAGSFAPDGGRRGATTTAPARCAWSGHGQGLRVENRLPGADVNPYLALAAMIAAGPARHRQRARARARLRGQRLRVRQAARAAQHVRRTRPVRGLGDRARGLRPGRGGPLPEPGPRSRSTHTRPRSPTGRSSAASSDCEGVTARSSASAPPSSARSGAPGRSW